jgi:hypothetical protein
MSPSESNEYQDVLRRLCTWTPEMRLSLAEDLLRSLHPVVLPGALRGVPVEGVLGIAAGREPPPDDETVRRWVAEYRAEK